MSVDANTRPKKHPLLVDFLQQYPSCDEDAVDKAFLVYQDLTEVKGWWATELAYSAHIERPYIIGQQQRFVQRLAVLPICVEENLTLQQVYQFFSHIHVDEEPIQTIILAVNDLDSSVVYYKLTSGLSPPEAPEVVTAKQHEKAAKIVKKRQFVASCVKRAMQAYSNV